MIDLIHCIPEKLAETVTIEELTETVLAITAWEERQAEVLDYIHRQILIRLLGTARRGEASARELRAFAEYLDRATHPARMKKLEHLEKPYGARWSAYQDVAESRLASLESDAPGDVMKLKNVRGILDMILEYGSVERKKIQERFTLKPANLTRILNIMEASDLIVSSVVGREKVFSAGANGWAFRTATTDSKTERGASYLRVA